MFDYDLPSVSSSPLSSSPASNFSPAPLKLKDKYRKSGKPYQFVPSSCQVCFGKATGHHYDVASCNGCKSFFRRVTIEKLVYKCDNHMRCYNDFKAGDKIPKCRACRYKRCVDVGMNPLGIQSELKKHTENLSAEDLESSGNSELVVLPRPMPGWPLAPEVIEEARKPNPNPGTRKILPPNVKRWVMYDLLTVVEMAKTFDFFNKLNEMDRYYLCRDTTLMVSNLTKAYFSVENKTDQLIRADGQFLGPPPKWIPKEYMDKLLLDIMKRAISTLIRMKCTKIEFLLLRAILLCNAAAPDISSSARAILQTERAKYTVALLNYTMANHGLDGPGRFAEILNIIDLLERQQKDQRDVNVFILLYRPKHVKLPLLDDVMLSFSLLTIWHAQNATAISDGDRDFQNQILTGYNSKIRPVKAETTVTQVTVFLNIAHVEKVDEAEQTALVHGHLWASWTDEYLQWDRAKTNITKITLPSHRIWQPALALYNRRVYARGNTWHLYMAGMPATVYFNGKVWSSGTFSFFVTCQFDFENWPFDKQNCPIVIADWVYGLAQVNLSDPNMISEYAKPSIRLSYDPLERKNKRHVGGWEVMDAWKKHCYWGPKGCKEDQPEGDLVPGGLDPGDLVPGDLVPGDLVPGDLDPGDLDPSDLVPGDLDPGDLDPSDLDRNDRDPFITSILVLLGFWIEKCALSCFIIFFNLALQTIYGYNIIKKLPPGSGTIPKVVQIFTLNLLITGTQFFIAIMFGFIKEWAPKNYSFNFGIDITDIPKRMGIDTFFQPKGLSFDPQDLFVDHDKIAAAEAGNDTSTIGIGNPLNDDEFDNFQNSATPSSNSDTELLINLPTNSEPANVLDSEKAEKSEEESKEKVSESSTGNTLDLQLLHIKRFLFFLVVFIYCVAFLMILFL
ncbi:unnamed protein product [Caenorhabditis nigoni]